MKKSDKLSKSFYGANRKKFLDSLEGMAAVFLFAGEAPHKTADEYYVFTPNRNFLYMTGLDAPKLIYFAYKTPEKTEEFLFIERGSKKKAKWVGRCLDAGSASDASGIENILFLDEFQSHVAEKLHTFKASHVYLDLESRLDSDIKSTSLRFYDNFAKSYPCLTLKDAGEIIGRMRGIKSDPETALIKRSIEITALAFEHIIGNASAGMYEYQLESCFDFALKYNGVRERAFSTIIASGKNASILHYSDNSSKIEDGDLVLMDFGAMYGCYCADISRTVPINGRFTERQKELYNTVLGGQSLVIAAVKPGATLNELNKILIEYYRTALKELGLIGRGAKGAALDALIEKYYWHKVGHSIGLNAHDPYPNGDVPLEPGMVITVEPGLYVEKEKTGIRIEDVLLVTKSGFIVLSEAIPKTVEDIERCFAESDGNK